LTRGTKPLCREPLCDGDRAGSGVERVGRRFCCIGFDLTLAQAGERRLGFREGTLKDWRFFDAAAPRDTERSGRAFAVKGRYSQNSRSL
jgi:hypothetical protein